MTDTEKLELLIKVVNEAIELCGNDAGMTAGILLSDTLATIQLK